MSIVSNEVKPIRYKFSAEKARAGLLLMLEGEGRHDLRVLLMACYLADRKHLNEWGRPIFGATYRARSFGPMPLEIYEMLKGEPLWLAELGLAAFPWRMNGFRVECANETADMRALSPSDVEALQWAHDLAASRMRFESRAAATHGRDRQAANLGVMRYEDMLDDGPDKAERVAQLRESAPYLQL